MRGEREIGVINDVVGEEIQAVGVVQGVKRGEGEMGVINDVVGEEGQAVGVA